MAASPTWKVYDAVGRYQAACKEIEAAACLVGLYGENATIRWAHGPVVWTEGKEDQSAVESYDHVGEVVGQRVAKLNQDAYARIYNRVANS